MKTQDYRQREILKEFENDTNRILTKSDLVKKFSHWYWCNAGKHIGDVLSRMVNNGSLERVSIGKFKLSTGLKNKFKKQIKDKNQINIF